MTDILDGRRASDHPSRWRWLFSPQATSLLLVVAVLLLAFVTVQTRTAAEAAKSQAVTNRTIIVQQDRAARDADLRAREQAVATADLARSTAATLLQQVIASNSARDGHLAGLLAGLQQNLTAAIQTLSDAIQRLQEALDRYAAQDRTADVPQARQRPRAPAPHPSPGVKPCPIHSPLCRLLP